WHCQAVVLRRHADRHVCDEPWHGYRPVETTTRRRFGLSRRGLLHEGRLGPRFRMVDQPKSNNGVYRTPLPGWIGSRNLARMEWKGPAASRLPSILREGCEGK